MLLVPRQLQRSAMTGDVPYYGGRLTPAHAYAASHPTPPPPGSVPVKRLDALKALQYLVDTGVITPDEHRRFYARVPA